MNIGGQLATFAWWQDLYVKAVQTLPLLVGLFVLSIQYPFSKLIIVLQLIGLAGIIVGALIRIKYDDYEVLTSKNIGGVSTLLIALGGIIFIVAFFGCCGAIRNSVVMLTIVCNYYVN